jgi:O-antigen/teichoic acid export membrane protein
METSFLRHYSEGENKDKIYASASILLLISSAIFCIFGTLGASFLSAATGIGDSLAVKMLVWTTVLDALVVIPFAYLRVTNKPLLYLSFKMLNILTLFVATILFLVILPQRMKSLPSFWSQPQVIHIFLSNLIASAVTFFVFLPIMTRVKWAWHKDTVKKMWRYGWPIMVGGLAFGLNENLDKLIISGFIDANTNGIYSACYKLSVFMTLYVTAFRLGAEPYFFNTVNHKDARQKYSQIMTWFVMLGGLFLLFVVVFIDFFANVFLRQSIYHQGLYLVPILLLANLFSGIYNNLSIWYKLTDKTKMGMFISLGGAVLTIMALLIFVPIFGMVGGAYATLLTYGAMMVVSYLLGQKYYAIPYEMRKIGFAIAVSTTFAAIYFLWLRDYVWIGVLLLLIYVGFMGFIQGVSLNLIKKLTPK